MGAVPSTADPLPRGWIVDHDVPTHFIVRCARCGRLAIETDRATAHTRADNHALRCRETGVTPARKPEDDEDDESGSTAEVEADGTEPAASDGGLDVLGVDITGQEIAVRYESVSKRAGEQQVIGDVTAMLPAPEQADFSYRGLIVRFGNQTRRRVDLLRDVVECPHNCEDGWRKAGDLTGLSPAQRADNPPVVMTDGGQVVEEKPDEEDVEDGEDGEEEDDEPAPTVDSLTTIIEASRLEKSIKVLESVSHEAVLRFGHSGLQCRLVDPGNVYMANLHLEETGFEAVGDGMFPAGSNLENLREFIGKADNDQLVELSFDAETRYLCVEFGPYEREFALIDPDTIRQEPDIPDLDHPNRFEIDAKRLKEVVIVSDMVSDHVLIEGDIDAECIRFVAEGDTDTNTATLDDELGFADVTDDNCETLLSVDWLNDAVKVIPSSAIVEITFGDEMPIKLRWGYADEHARVEQMIAPRIQAR